RACADPRARPRRCRHLGRLHQYRYGARRLRHGRARRNLRGMVEAGPTRSGHRTPTIIVEAPVNGTDIANVRYNAWQFRQILGRGAHGVLLCQAETPGAVRAFVESCRYPHHLEAVDPFMPTPLERMRGE